MLWVALSWLFGTVYGACPTPNPQRTVCTAGTCTHTTIAAAVSAAANNDVICVEAGTYTDQIVLNSAKRVRVEANGPVVVSTGTGGEIIRIENGGDLELVGLDIEGNTSRRCIYVQTAGSSLLLDGVDLTNCKQATDGAGIYLQSGTQATIRHSNLQDNGGTSGNGGTLYANAAASLDVVSTSVDGGRGSAGGAFFLSSTDTLLDDVDFIDNAAGSGRGGSIYALNSPLQIIGGSFRLSTASGEGGCLNLEGNSSLTVTGTLFQDCDARHHGGAIHHVASGAIDIDRATFLSNAADSDTNNSGSGGGIYATTASSVLITEAEFSQNAGASGAGLYTSNIAHVDVLRSSFVENASTSDGGGAYHSGLSNLSLLANNLYQDNTCADDGGGLHSVNGSATVRNNVFLENDCPGPNHDGDGAHFEGGNTVLQNNVFAYHADEGARKAGGGSLASSYNLWFGNATDVVGFVKGTGEITGSNPLFWSYIGNGVPDDIFVPAAGSPLIDAGSNDAALNDLDGTRNDIGMYGGPDAKDLDQDGDGSQWPLDCDDLDPAVRPGGVEIAADGKDGDCNGTESCYQDTDGDGYGTPTIVQSTALNCVGAGISPFSTDCAPANAARHPGVAEIPANGIDENCDNLESCYRDLDDDNFGDTSTASDDDLDCTDEPFQSDVPTDCDDSSASIYPGAPETPANGVDQNCDGLEACYQDLDNDDYGTPTLVTSSNLSCFGQNISTVSNDCQDNLASRNPGASEIPANGIDEDCSAGDLCYSDTDGDTYGHPFNTVVSADLDCADSGEAANNTDCDPTNGAIHPFAVELIANGIDEDCSGGDSCYRDYDGDTVPGTTYTVVSADLDCTDPGEFASGSDCDDNDPNRYPGKVETVANGIDEDCDGVESCFDDDDSDTYGDVIQDSQDLDCTDPKETWRGGDCDDTLASVFPGAIESVADGRDQNCDGNELCYADADNDGYGLPTTVISNILSCTGPGVSTNPLDCNDGLANAYPGAPEVVSNGIDESCDGVETCWRDNDGDGYGTTLSTLVSADLDCLDANESWYSTDCNDNNAGVSPSALEITNNGIDENCDGLERCYQDLDGDTYGRNTTVLSAALSCNGTGVANDNLDCNDTNAAFYPGAPEIVGDSLDQDCSGTDTVRCYRDEDQDGYGSSTEILAPDGACNLGALEANLSGDCNDANDTIHPQANEIKLDGIDQDCDGSDLRDCYQDSDNDGYGVPITVPFEGDCGPAINMADNAADCDDNNVAVHPGAPDVCNDGIDTDCSGELDEDGDGLDYLEEADIGTSDCDTDSDDDLATDLQEELAQTNPLQADSDGDGLLDGEEFGGFSPVDTDGDGIIDPLDHDDDGDNVPTAVELALASLDWDNDELPNHLDDDDDGDTVITQNEDPDSNGSPLNDDTDGDGDANWLDPDDDNDGVLTALEVAVTANPLSRDSDGDTLSDGDEWGMSGPPRDTDNDGLPDIIDTDDDNDGIESLIEGSGDPDGDGVPNARDTNSDNDTRSDFDEGSQNDTDLDGVPDWLDANDTDGEAGDVDQDGLITRDEFLLGTESGNPDTDDDGVPDGLEVGDPDNPLDTDGNGILDVFDLDNDGDFVPTRLETGVLCDDGRPSYTLSYNNFGLVVECPYNLGPAPELIFQDTDGDALFDFEDADDDGDGVLTEDEDTNGNGDWFDDDHDGDAVPDFIDVLGEDGPLGDMDGDGLGNAQEEELGSSPYSDDTDNDGIPDGDELIDFDNDGIPGFLDEDDDGDSIPTSEEGSVDTDGDGSPDYLDTDSDNDGVYDWTEGGQDSDCDGLDNRVDNREDAGCQDGPPESREFYVAQGCGCSGSGLPSVAGWALLLCGLLIRRRRAA